MKIKVLILLFCLPLSEAYSKVYGPICQWYQDPSTSMAIHWVHEKSGEDSESTDRADVKGLNLESLLSYRAEGQE